MNPTSKYNTDSRHYWLWMMSYGIITLLKLLNYFEAYENFEECAKIIDCINKHNQNYNSNLPTVLSNKTYIDVKEDFKKFNLTGNFIEDSTDTYFDYILLEMEKLEITNTEL